MKKQINTSAAPAAIGPYSQAIEANGIVFVSGQLPIDPAIAKACDSGKADELQLEAIDACCANIEEVLK